MKKIMIYGVFDSGPIGRHAYSWLMALLLKDECEIYIKSINKVSKKELANSEFITSNNFKKRILRDITVLENGEHRRFKFDFSIYTDIVGKPFSCDISPSALDFIEYDSNIKAAYCVHDGSFPPIEWGQFIDKHFDLCLTPSHYVADTFKKYLLSTPCFAVPCGVFLIKPVEISVTCGKTMHFGMICGMDSRKSPLNALKAFVREFEPYENTSLIIHSQYTSEIDYKNKFEHELNTAVEKGYDIKYSFGAISQEELEEKYKLIDVYISIQNASGYFTTICEALKLGKPIIYSEIPVHQELFSDLNLQTMAGIYPVKTDVVGITSYPFYGGRTIGLKYDCKEIDIQDKMRKAFSELSIISDIESIKSRQKIADGYDITSLKEIYHSVLFPENIFISKTCGVSSTGDIYLTEHLAKKYKKIYKNKNVDDSDFIPKEMYEVPQEKFSRKLDDLVYDLHLRQSDQANYKNNDTSILFMIRKRMDGLRVKEIISLGFSKCLTSFVYFVSISFHRIRKQYFYNR